MNNPNEFVEDVSKGVFFIKKTFNKSSYILGLIKTYNLFYLDVSCA